MEPTINERFVKLSSRVPFPEDIALGDDISVDIKGRSFIFNCVKTEELDNQDGSIDKVFILKSTVE
jgi:hypothetical protein